MLIKPVFFTIRIRKWQTHWMLLGEFKWRKSKRGADDTWCMDGCIALHFFYGILMRTVCYAALLLQNYYKTKLIFVQWNKWDSNLACSISINYCKEIDDAARWETIRKSGSCGRMSRVHHAIKHANAFPWCEIGRPTEFFWNDANIGTRAHAPV